MLKYLAATSLAVLVSLFLGLRPQLFDLHGHSLKHSANPYFTMASQSVSRSVVKKVLAIEQSEGAGA